MEPVDKTVTQTAAPHLASRGACAAELQARRSIGLAEQHLPESLSLVENQLVAPAEPKQLLFGLSGPELEGIVLEVSQRRFDGGGIAARSRSETSQMT